MVNKAQSFKAQIGKTEVREGRREKGIKGIPLVKVTIQGLGQLKD